MKTALIILIQLGFFTTLNAQVETNYNGKFVEVTWVNPKNVSIDYFIIEKSNNGKNYKELLTVPKQNIAGGKIVYEADYSKPKRKTYYRIKNVETGGNSYYSNVSYLDIKKNKIDSTPNNTSEKEPLLVLENK